MRLPQKKENKKISAIKYFNNYVIPILVAVIGVAVITLAIVLPIRFAPTYTTQATVTAVGYKGVTVEYKGKYGEDLTKEVDVDDVSEYQIGDTVTIKIKFFDVDIVEECDDARETE